MINRYINGSGFPQPTRKILKSGTDILHPLKMGERIDNLAYKYYNDATLGWIIMCGNQEWDNELSIPIGSTVRVPYPLQRVLNAWQIGDQL